MVTSYLTLSGRIRRELSELERVADRVAEGWRRSQSSNDDHYLDGVALNLHAFYAGLERVLELIASEVDGFVPQGAQWHIELIRQMASAIPQVREAVIGSETAAKLDAYRGFRHVVRNVYTYNLDAGRIHELVRELPAVLTRVSTELTTFADHLETLADVDTDGQ